MTTPGAAPDLRYSDTEEELRSAVRSLLAARCTPADVLARAEGGRPHDPALWHTLAAGIGTAGLLVPEELGGQGAGPREAAVVLEELGRAAAPAPYLAHAVLCAVALLGCDPAAAPTSSTTRSAGTPTPPPRSASPSRAGSSSSASPAAPSPPP
ncbi:acyl-CoA dehydrogenase family protein, partial [Streptomyces sp. WAC05292]|uniref:acyl-CoA dehydrogenase family protein n=1 Tax=Streptomyces sp. WAC05292 TaxID=2487418 RepID=UPI0021B00D3D